MADPYPNESANTIYSHLRSLSNTIGDFGDTVASLQLSAILPGPPDPTMPSFNRPGSIRRRFLRIISFGRYSSGSADDTEPLTKAFDSSRRHSAPADMDAQSTNRPTYTAHRSPQSSDSAQTTIIHEVPSGAAPFSISAFRDQHRGRHISDTEFDTPPSLEAAQETTHPVGITRPIDTTRPVTPTYPGAPWNTAWNPARLHRDKSYLQCNVCNRVLEYHQIHCPGCAARTLHHVPVPIESSYTDSRDRDVEPRSLQLRKGRQNEQHDAMTEESSWDTEGLEAGTAEESWTTTTHDAVDIAFPKATAQESSSPAETHEPHSEQMDTICLHIHCCCGTSKANNHASTQCTNTYTLRLRRHTAAVIFVHSNPGNGACKHTRGGNARDNHICCRIWDGEHADITDEASQGCMCGGGKQGEVPKKTAWWMRWSKWFCCC